MKAGVSLRSAALLALAGAAAGSTGCVLVVGDGTPGRGDVEWSSDWGHSRAEPEIVDRGLAQEVGARIRADSALAGEDITVSSNGDVVTLHGRVSNIALLENALRIATEAPGVTRVVSRVTVEMEPD